MSTYLALVQNTEDECNIPTLLTAVASQTGMHRRFANWVKQAWTEIQGMSSRWRWMQVAFTFQTVSGTDDYAYTAVTDVLTGVAIARFSRWLAEDEWDNYKIYKTSDGVGSQRRLYYLDWAAFRYIYQIGTQNNNPPVHITIDPQNNLVLGPTPDAAYTVTGEYMRGAQVLAADGDTPDMPSQYHDLIMYLAMQKYGLFISATEVVAGGEFGFNNLWPQLQASQAPRIRMAGPLV